MAAINGHNGVAAALVAVSLMTKPQAIAVHPAVRGVVLGHGRTRPGGVRGGVIELVRDRAHRARDVVVLWLPFLPNGGPAGYLATSGMYQTEIFRILSLRAWNAWWLLQEAAGRWRVHRRRRGLPGAVDACVTSATS